MDLGPYWPFYERDRKLAGRWKTRVGLHPPRCVSTGPAVVRLAEINLYVIERGFHAKEVRQFPGSVCG